MAKTTKYETAALKIEVGNGVLGKDKKPYAPGIIMAGAERKLTPIPGMPDIPAAVMMSPYNFSITTLLGLLANEMITNITVVTEENIEFKIVKTVK